MKVPIYRVLNDDYTDKAGKPFPHVTYYKPSIKNQLINDGQDATLEELTELCDQDAESCNAHDFCGSHRLLGSLLCRRVGRAKATEIMLDIARFGGQHGMGGICRDGDAYKDLNVGRAGFDWAGSFPK